MTSALQHVGYFPGSVDAADSIEEQAGHANVTKVISVSWNHNSGEWTDPAPAFQRARNAGMAVLMNLPEGADRPRFAEWAAVVQPHAADILAFFVMDEPDCACAGNPSTLALLLAGIEADIARVQQHFGAASRSMITLGCFNELLPGLGFRMPAGLTDVALECYHGRAQWQAWLDRLAPYLTPAHHLWLMPAVSPQLEPPYAPQTETEMIFEAQAIYEYAKTDPRVVGLLPFCWVDGARDRPAVRHALTTIGREIVHGDTWPPVDLTARLAQIVPPMLTAGRPFTLALLGDAFAPRAIAQASVDGVTFFDVTVSYRNATTLTVSGLPVPVGTYAVRVRNPDGTVTAAQAVVCR